MSIDWRYMPILKWKQGEQLALRNLTEDQWQRLRLMPLIELQPIDAAPDAASIKAELPAYLKKAAEQITKSLPSERGVCVDAEYVSPAYPKQANLLIVVCTYLQREAPRPIIPVFHTAILESLGSLSSSQQEFLKGQQSIVLRLRTDQIEPSQVVPAVTAITELGIKRRNLHLLIDQYSLVDRQHADCLAAVRPYIDNAVSAKCASVTIGGGSFPINLVGLKRGVTEIPRVEWMVWELLQKSGAYPDLRYADYTVTNPAPLPNMDATAMNPSIAIRYAAGQFWRLYKGRGFKSGVPGEYRNLCKLLVTDDIYSGEPFSYGDAQYNKASNGGDRNGNPSSWRKEATNHHIVLTASAL